MSVESRGGSAHRGRADAAAPTGGPAAQAGARRPRDETAAELTRLLTPEVAAAGFDLEAVEVRPAGRRRLVKIVVDGDDGVSLDDVADLSQAASELLDASDVMGTAPYVLEVTSPGVDRPLTEARHWRRAAGRLVVAPLTDGEGGQIEGRVVSADEDGVVIDVTPTKGKSVKGRPVKPVRREFAYADLGPGHVQVEFRSDADTAGKDAKAGAGKDATDATDAADDLDDLNDLDMDAEIDADADEHGDGEPVDDLAGEAEETRSPAEPE
ncbi:ribosome maturation factor RimP [Actinomadura harenae]|uniref:Ribosome maturation factor RimP n=1 Tax=Actinomadura harenae TaxID=2483351 RepID=A0A3M2M3N9_9ACTN|nr:ribosome maturation factor RimP [Actinomadura harenae]